MIPTQPIGHGGRCLAQIETSGFTLDETWYPRGLELEAHSHERANLCIVLQGALTERSGCRKRVCEPATLIVKPAGEEHSDLFHGAGARCLNIAVEQDQLARMDELLPALSASQYEVDPRLLTLGHRLCMELQAADDVSPLAVESLTLELIAGRIRAARRRSARSPDWMERARDYLHDNFSRPLGLSAVAAAVGRHPAHVAQNFRRRYGLSIGEYVRRLRVDHVARRLVTSRASLAQLACEAGFTDQSHMQRVFKSQLGVTPAAYRRARR